MTLALTAHMSTFLRRRSLDAQLEQGRNPALSPELELRATQLTRLSARRRLATSIRGILAEASRPGARPQLGTRIPFNRSAVLDCRVELSALAERLTADDCPRPRGIAIARRLLYDGGGPLYVRSRASQLPHAVHTAYRSLLVAGD